MEQILINILNRIDDQVPGLSLVDEDYGQLEFVEDTYPVTFPCVLVGNINTDWEGTKQGCQRGKATFTTRLAIDCYDDTHVSSGTTGKIAERMALKKAVVNALQGFIPDNCASPMFRQNSRDFSLAGGIKVYETTFRFSVHD